MSPILTSSLTGLGLDQLWTAVEGLVFRQRIHDAVAFGVVLNERHRQRLTTCRADLKQLLNELEQAETEPAHLDLTLEVTGTLLSSILGHLGEVSGRVFTEHLLETVFQRFCVGK
jgi:tRNA modification GTPase